MRNINYQKGAGATIGIILIIIVILLGAIYFLGQKTSLIVQNEQNSEMTADRSDEISVLENDAASLDFDNLDVGIDELEF